MHNTPQYPKDKKGYEYNPAFDESHKEAWDLSRRVQKTEGAKGSAAEFEDTALESFGEKELPQYQQGDAYNPNIGGHEEAWQLSRDVQKAQEASKSRSKLAAAVEGTPDALVLNEEAVLMTLKRVFGNELKLSEKELVFLTDDYEANWRAFTVSGVWPNLESALARTDKVKNMTSVNKKREFIRNKADQIMERLAA